MPNATTPFIETAVVILNWNGRKFLEQFLPRLIECTNSEKIELVVADNHSTDDSVDFMREHYPHIRLILNESNGGFAKGYNDALSQVNAEYYVLLNSDIEVTPNWVEPIIEKMKADPLVGAAQPKLRSFFNRDCFEYAGAAGGFLDYLGYPFCRGRVFDCVEKDQGQYDNECEIFWATGAALFVRADLYHMIGGLDNDFFAHMEEIDLCWRIHSQGYKVMYYPQSTVYHVGGGTLPKSSSTKTYLNFRNNLSLLYKNLPSARMFSVFAIRLPLDILAATVFLLKGQPGDFKAVFKAYRDFWGMRKRNQEKRRFQKQVIRCTGTYWKSLVMQHYLFGIKQFSQLKPNDFER